MDKIESNSRRPQGNRAYGWESLPFLLWVKSYEGTVTLSLKIFFSFEIVFWRILNDVKCTCEFLRQSLAHPLAKVGWIYYPPLQCTQWRCPCRSCLRIHLLLPVPTVTPSQSGFTGVAGALVGYEPISDRLLVVRLSAKP